MPLSVNINTDRKTYLPNLNHLNIFKFFTLTILLGMTCGLSAKAQILRELSDRNQLASVRSSDWFAVSPDAKMEAAASDGNIYIREVGQKNSISAALADSTLLSFGDVPSAVHWSASSDSIWSAVWPWPNGTMHPVKIDLTGEIHEVAEPPSDSGPLDSILYLNGSGLAIVTYDIRHIGNASTFGNPTLALVDFSAKTRLASLQLNKPLRVTAGGEQLFEHPSFIDGDAVELPSGGVRFVGAINFMRPWWLVWDTRGEARVFPKIRGWALDRAKLSPDGSRLLAARNLQGSAPCGFDAPNCTTPSQPNTGPSFIMYDARTGAELWRRFEGPVYSLWPARPVFSPDGYFAVVALPPLVSGDSKGRIGVISTANGQLLADAVTDFYGPILQLLPDGKTLVVSTINHVQTFAVDWDAATRARAVQAGASVATKVP